MILRSVSNVLNHADINIKQNFLRANTLYIIV